MDQGARYPFGFPNSIFSSVVDVNAWTIDVWMVLSALCLLIHD